MTRRTDGDATGCPELRPHRRVGAEPEGGCGRVLAVRTPSTLRPATGLALALLLLTACAERGDAGAAPSATDPAPETATLPADEAALVLQVEHTGGYVSPETTLGRLPLVSVYADGRVISQGPVAAIYPGPAWPNVQVQQADRATVQELADHALAAGLTDTTDLGAPGLADAPSTRFTLATDAGPVVREVYALQEAAGAGGLTADQESARAELQALFDELTALPSRLDPQGGATASYEPTAVAALARPWTDPVESAPGGGLPELSFPDVAWPGTALPGEPAGPGLGCVTATGEQAVAVTAAARTATTLTPWVGADGARWAVTFRPLLPGESGCADLGG